MNHHQALLELWERQLANVARVREHLYRALEQLPANAVFQPARREIANCIGLVAASEAVLRGDLIVATLETTPPKEEQS